ncbi:hypothetical protein BpHYR1_046624 [Brachionus plicatilis]|uniref:Uncharacterized protein n=1 Tax=Brachionus plicatilis TaxID=10195 RepID=A0A3M7Q7T7_BRAPC|nr:hypothetical protein BpHYR1_046624 [Brachionus plicatilis]
MTSQNCAKCAEYENAYQVLLRKIHSLSSDKTALDTHRLKTQKLIDDLKQEQENAVHNFTNNLENLLAQTDPSAAQIISTLSDQLKIFYQCSFIPDFEAQYGTKLFARIDSLVDKVDTKESEARLADLATELGDFKSRSVSIRIKLKEQKRQIENLLGKSGKKSNTGSSPYTSVASSNTTIASSSTSGLGENLVVNQEDLYTCPICLTSIESCKISGKKFNSHVKKCDETKICCMFCLKLYDKSEHVLLENHVQKHMIKQYLTRSPTTTISVVKKLSDDKKASESDLAAKTGSSSGNSSFFVNDAALDQTDETGDAVDCSTVMQYLKLADS